MSDPVTRAPARARPLGAELPADGGLAALGLLMQLAGDLGTALLAPFAVEVLLRLSGATAEAAWLLLMLVTCLVRARVHRGAGVELLHGRAARGADGEALEARPGLDGVRRYVRVGLAQAAFMGLVLRVAGPPAPWAVVVGWSVALAAWPAALAVLLRRPHLARFAGGVPLGEDKGLEGVATLMIVLGGAGLVATGVAVRAMLAGDGEALRGGGALALLALIALAVRSALHVQAGALGLRETSLERSVKAGQRYASYAVISSICMGGVLAVSMLATRLQGMALASAAAVVLALMAWPLAVRRFFQDRQFAALLAAPGAEAHRRAPDGGLTGLGWLLLAVGAGQLALLAVVEGYALAYDGGGGAASPAAAALAAALQLATGAALVGMHRRRRAIAACNVAAAALAVAVSPASLGHAITRLTGLGQGDAWALQHALPLGLPLAALLLAGRAVAPTARARIRASRAA